MTKARDINHPSDSIIVDRSIMSAFVLVDADNTLWDTDKVFQQAQLNLLAAVEEECKVKVDTPNRLEFVRSIDQEIAGQHHLGLRYPPRFLIAATAMTLNGVGIMKAATTSWKSLTRNRAIGEEQALRIERGYYSDLEKIPALRPGVRDGLTGLCSLGASLVILTEGSRERVKRTAEYHGIIAHFDRVLEVKKERRMFERVLRTAERPSVPVMVGDQISKDIAPAKEAGFVTIYIPGFFTPRWENNQSFECVDFEAIDFAAVPDIVKGLLSEDGSTNRDERIA